MACKQNKFCYADDMASSSGSCSSGGMTSSSPPGPTDNGRALQFEQALCSTGFSSADGMASVRATTVLLCQVLPCRRQGFKTSFPRQMAWQTLLHKSCLLPMAWRTLLDKRRGLRLSYALQKGLLCRRHDWQLSAVQPTSAAQMAGLQNSMVSARVFLCRWCGKHCCTRVVLYRRRGEHCFHKLCGLRLSFALQQGLLCRRHGWQFSAAQPSSAAQTAGLQNNFSSADGMAGSSALLNQVLLHRWQGFKTIFPRQTAWLAAQCWLSKFCCTDGRASKQVFLGRLNGWQFSATQPSFAAQTAWLQNKFTSADGVANIVSQKFSSAEDVADTAAQTAWLAVKLCSTARILPQTVWPAVWRVIALDENCGTVQENVRSVQFQYALPQMFCRLGA